MGLLDRFRTWLVDVCSGTDSSDESTSCADIDADTTAAEGSVDSGLDPTLVTETRTESTDDNVDKLREIRNRPVDEADSAASADGVQEPFRDDRS